jgi:hypothetical protein
MQFTCWWRYLHLDFRSSKSCPASAGRSFGATEPIPAPRIGLVRRNANKHNPGPQPRLARGVGLFLDSGKRAAVDKDYLTLKCASVSRPSGEWNDEDFDVLADGVVVGRIMKAAAVPVSNFISALAQRIRICWPVARATSRTAAPHVRRRRTRRSHGQERPRDAGGSLLDRIE